MTPIEHATWSLYVGEYIDRVITPYALKLLDLFRDGHQKRHWPKRTKIQGIYQRSLAVKTPAQAFLSQRELEGFKTMASGLEATSAFGKDYNGKVKAAVSRLEFVQAAGQQSFEAFLQERSLLEDRRGQQAHRDFYDMVKDSLTGEEPRSAKRAASYLVTAANVPETTQRSLREWTQVHLLHAWVDGLCLRIMPDLKEI